MTRRGWLASLAMALATAASAFAQARPYTQLYVFGDSYSDSGAGYVDGNGPTAVVYLARRLAIPFTYFGDPKTHEEKPVHEGLDFAVSGARSGEAEGTTHPAGELLGRGMRNQVNDFAALVKSGAIRFDPQQTMFYFAGGLNDRSLKEGETVANLEGEIDTLYSLGARRFEVALMPVKIPAFAAVAERLNPQLAGIPADMQAKHPELQITNSQWGPYFDEVISHPAKYGLTDTTNRCAGRTLFHEDSTPCASPETHFYYHEGHPSTAVHKAVGDLLYSEAMQSARN